MRHVGLALSRAGIGVALLEIDRGVRHASFPARFVLAPDGGLDFRWDEDAGPDVFTLADVERSVRDPRNQASFHEALLVRILLDLAATWPPLFPSTASIAIGLDHRAPAGHAAAAIGAARRLGFSRVRVLFLHEAAAAHALVADPSPVGHAAVELGPPGAVVRIEKRTEAGRAHLTSRPDGMGPEPEGAQVVRLDATDARALSAAGLAQLSAAGDPPIVREWHFALSIGDSTVLFPELVPIGDTPRRVAHVAARAPSPAWDPVVRLLAGASREVGVEDLLPCGLLAVNKWVLEDNAGFFLMFLEIEGGRTVRWGHQFPRTGERIVASVPEEILGS